MSETEMPVAEAEAVVEGADELSSYELAFHVLPTVAEGEVEAVFGEIKSAITNAGGELFDEEAPERFDLAYEVVKHIEGKNRKFTSAYFGWVRFKGVSASVAELTAAVEGNVNILRHLLIRLTRVEEEHPFHFHKALGEQKTVTTVEESEVVPDLRKIDENESDHKEEEEAAPVDEKELDKALEEKEA